MKICILLSSYEGTGSDIQEYDAYQNPGIYAKSHQFEKRLVTKENANKQIDRIIEEGGFDYIWNFLWGAPDDVVAGTSAIEYLESKNVPVIGTSSKYSSLTKLDFKKAFEFAQVKTPKGITLTADEDLTDNLELNFPLIVKPSNGCGNDPMTTESVCHSLPQLLQQIKLMKCKTKRPILIEEFIVGEEISIMVLETEDGVVALTPLMYSFPNQWKETEKFFDFDKRRRGIDSGEITYKLFDGDSDTVERIKVNSIKAYLALGVLGSGYARVGIRLKDGEPYFLEVNHTPAFFSHIGNKFGDDFVIETTYPGGHEAFVDTVISSRLRFDSVNRLFSKFSATYKDVTSDLAASIYSIWTNLCDKFDFSGTVLDLGCGTGTIGNIIQQKYESTLTGIDLCSEMAKFAKNYEKVHIGLIENVMLELNGTYDHIISSAALLYCCERNFEQIFSILFNRASSSITLAVEDLSDDFILKSEEFYNMRCVNHSKTIENLRVPSDWILVYKKRDFFWQSPKFGDMVFGVVYRYEKKLTN